MGKLTGTKWSHGDLPKPTKKESEDSNLGNQVSKNIIPQTKKPFRGLFSSEGSTSKADSSIIGPRCRICKTTENLMPKPTLCRTCNTERSKRYRATPKGREAVRKAGIKSLNKHPDKQRARIKIRVALESGKIIRPSTCTGCSLEKTVEAHHDDYSKPFEVKWLCRQCHADVHRQLKIEEAP